jgi:hypothetical protein
MTLFPQLSDTYYTDQDHDILKLIDYTYAKNIQINQSFWNEAETDQRFRAGDQSLWNDIYGNIPAFRRKQFNFNRIRRITNMITGYQRQHRKSTVCTPVENSDEATANQFSKILLWDDQKNHVLETISDAFDGAVVTGMNLLSVWMDYRNDPVNGDIAVDNVAFNGYLIDPYFKKMDLSDCNSIWTRKYLSRNQVKSLLPGRESELLDMKGWGNRDGKFQFMPESYNYGMQDLLTYDEFWYLDSRKQKLLCDLQTGETMEWRGQDEDLKDFMRQYGQIITLDQEIQTTKLAIVVQGRVMYNGPNPLNIDRYPFVPVWAYYEPQMSDFPWRIQGVVRGLRDAQYLYNRRRVIELDILESQITSGFMYKENALVNPKDVFLQGQGRGLALKANAQPGIDVMKIEAPQIPPSMIQLSELLGKEVQEISGVSEELLGMANDDKAGILSMIRQGANLTTLQGLFDNLDYAQKMLGDIRISLVQGNWTPGKVQRVIGQEPSQQFYNRAFGKYKAIVEDGLNTSTQRQMQFAQLLQLRELGIQVPAEILVESSTLQNKEKLTNALSQQEQQASQAAQEQHQAQVELLKAQIEDLHARAVANQGLGHERASRIQENQALAVERRAAAHKDLDQGTLDRARAVKELTSIDLDQFYRAIEILKLIQEKPEEESAPVPKTPERKQKRAPTKKTAA